MLFDLKKFIVKSRRHWLFWPFFFFLLQAGAYIFFFSENGYLAYLNAYRKKVQIEERIASLEKQKKQMGEKLGLLKNRKSALKHFSREFLLFENKVRILKFVDEQKEQNIKHNEGYDIAFYQKAYLAATTVILLAVTFIFKKISLRPVEDEE